MHCHIGWHVAMGFSMQIIEGPQDAIRNATQDSCGMNDNCASWNAYSGGLSEPISGV